MNARKTEKKTYLFFQEVLIFEFQRKKIDGLKTL